MERAKRLDCRRAVVADLRVRPEVAEEDTEAVGRVAAIVHHEDPTVDHGPGVRWIGHAGLGTVDPKRQTHDEFGPAPSALAPRLDPAAVLLDHRPGQRKADPET